MPLLKEAVENGAIGKNETVLLNITGGGEARLRKDKKTYSGRAAVHIEEHHRKTDRGAAVQRPEEELIAMLKKNGVDFTASLPCEKIKTLLEMVAGSLSACSADEGGRRRGHLRRRRAFREDGRPCSSRARASGT